MQNKIASLTCRNCTSSFLHELYRTRFCSDRCKLYYKVEKLPDDGCWIWTRSLFPTGYGAINWTDKLPELAHRVVWRFEFGEIPEGMFVCHRCDNRKCVNPAHLFIGSHSDNMADMTAKGRAAWKNKKMPHEVRAKISATRRASGWKPSKDHLKRLISGGRISRSKFLTFNGETMNMSDWAVRIGLSRATVEKRRKLGLPIEIILSPKSFRGHPFQKEST